MTISAAPVAAFGVAASDKAVAGAKGPRMDLPSYVSMPSMRTLRWSFVGAATERVRARVYVLRVSERGATVIFSHRLAAVLRLLPVE